MVYCKKCGSQLANEAKFCPICGTAVAPGELAPNSVESKAAARPMATSGLKYALWSERLLAWLIDIGIVGVAFLILGLLTALGGFSLSYTLLPGWPDWIPFFNLNLNGLVLFLYWMFMESMYGQSIGKMVMRIKVTRLDGSPIAVSHAALESFGKAFFLLLDFLIGWLLYPKSRQRIFNYISQTIVIKAT